MLLVKQLHKSNTGIFFIGNRLSGKKFAELVINLNGDLSLLIGELYQLDYNNSDLFVAGENVEFAH